MKNKLFILLICLTMIVSTSFASEVTTQVIPNDAKLEYNQGVDFYKLGRYDEAVAAFRTAIRLYPDYIDAYYNLGSLLEYLQQNKEALAIFEQIITRNNKEYEALYKASKISAELGDREKSAKYAAMISKSSEYATKADYIMQRYHITPQSANTTDNPTSNTADSSGCYPNITSPTGITSDKYGNIYVSSFTDNAIIKIQPDGKKMLFYKSPNLKGPISIASDSIGNIYVANYNANNVLKISSNGDCIILTSDVIQPYGVHVNGNMLFVACQGTNSVLRIKLK